MLDALMLINQAVAVYGDTPVQSLGEETPGGQSVALLYDRRLDFNLGIYPWSFAKKLFALSLDNQTTPYSGFEHVHLLPAERLEAPDYVTNDITSDSARFHRYTIIDGRVHSNETGLYALCRYRVEPIAMSAAFRAAHVQSLAADLCRARTGNKALSSELMDEAYGPPSEAYMGGMMGAARRADGFGTPPRTQDRSQNPLEQARWY